MPQSQKQSRAAHLRAQADDLTALTKKTRSEQNRLEYLRLAVEYEKLAKDAERAKAKAADVQERRMTRG